MGRPVSIIALTLALASGGVTPLGAQGASRAALPRPLLALAHSDLTFGNVLPGIPSSVDVHDQQRAALFELAGAADAAVRVEFVLPTALLGAGGALLPVSFGPTDGYADFSRGRPPRGIAFNPHAPLISSLGPNGRLWVKLGGTVQPGRPQPGGSYSATIFVTVYDIST